MSVEGVARRKRAQGARAGDLHADLHQLDPGLAEWADEFIFSDVWGRPGISHEERMLVAVSSLATQGRLPQLRNYLFGALQDGIAPEKIQEVLVMLVVYAGFPTALGALAEWRDVRTIAERKGLIRG